MTLKYPVKHMVVWHTWDYAKPRIPAAYQPLRVEAMRISQPMALLQSEISDSEIPRLDLVCVKP